MDKNKKTQNPSNGVKVNFSQLSHKILSNYPIGGITALISGYFTNNDNTGFTMPTDPSYITSNTINNVNLYLETKGFRVCDGTSYYNIDSPIYNQLGRYLPYLTDNRFLMGSTVLGGSGGWNVLLNHSHNFNFLGVNVSLTSIPVSTHYHSMSISASATDVSHSHGALRTGGDESIDWFCTEGGKNGVIPDPTRHNVLISTLYGYSHGTSSSSRHTFTFYINNNSNVTGNINHSHPSASLSGAVGSGSLPVGGFYPTINNLPNYITCIYIQRVK
jgi:hypothetical protein